MANKVFANGRELACKAGSGIVIAAFPDVCFTPPQTPATPPGVPLPYPNTAKASDTSSGSKSVKVSKKEIMLKNKSFFKTSVGDEAGCAPKKGLISSKTKGKSYFKSWSSDVKFEGENVDRHLDMTTNNHASDAGNEALPWAFIDTGVFATDKACEDDKDAEEKACADYKPKGSKDACADAGLDESIPNSDAKAVSAGYSSKQDFGDQKAKKADAKNKAAQCITARKCRLVPYKKKKQQGNVGECCESQTGDHLVPKSSFFSDKYGGSPMPGWGNYDADAAPVMCLEGGSTSGSHGLRHTHHKAMVPADHTDAAGNVAFNKEVDHCVEGAAFVAPHCSPACLKAQIVAGHEGMGDRRKKIRHSSTGSDPTSAQLTAMKKFGKKMP
jgi:hypothetical protein